MSSDDRPRPPGEAAAPEAEGPHVVVVSGGVSSPSLTRLLADRAANAVADALTADGHEVRTSQVELSPLAGDVAAALVSGLRSSELTVAIDLIAAADILVVSTPVYKAGVSGLVKSFLDVLDDDLVVGKIVVLAGTAGSPRHALAVEDHLRPVFAFMRAITAPTALFAAPEDWADPALRRRLDRAALETRALWRAGLEAEVSSSWAQYRHAFGGRSRHAPELDRPDFDTPLMRLAAGGREGMTDA